MNDRETLTGIIPVHGADDPDLLLPQRIDEPVVLRLGYGETDHHPTGGDQRLAVFVGSADSYNDERRPVAGRDEHDERFLRFTPVFDFVAGQAYVVRTRRHGEPDRLTEFRIPREVAAAPALVTDVYPSGDVLPENVLRLYVHFSVPMTPHLASDFVALRNESGRVDRSAFMKFKQELWNADRTRLTVLIDPGRIKRSVATNLDLGPALLEGQRFALTVDEGWPAADGSSVLQSFSKSFRVGPALRERPNVRQWKSRSPRVGTREPLVITFDRPFDRHLLNRALHAVASDGQTIDGTALVGESEMSWSFIPVEPWIAPGMHVTVEDALEDVAGNNFRELLDRDVGQRLALEGSGPDESDCQGKGCQMANETDDGSSEPMWAPQDSNRSG
jgi:hypothetical protein